MSITSKKQKSATALLRVKAQAFVNLFFQLVYWSGCLRRCLEREHQASGLGRTRRWRGQPSPCGWPRCRWLRYCCPLPWRPPPPQRRISTQAKSNGWSCPTLWSAPESVAFDGRDVGSYVNVVDGRIVRWAATATAPASAGRRTRTARATPTTTARRRPSSRLWPRRARAGGRWANAYG
jgi:hypothetical protein